MGEWVLNPGMAPLAFGPLSRSKGVYVEESTHNQPPWGWESSMFYLPFYPFGLAHDKQATYWMNEREGGREVEVSSFHLLRASNEKAIFSRPCRVSRVERTEVEGNSNYLLKWSHLLYIFHHHHHNHLIPKVSGGLSNSHLLAARYARFCQRAFWNQWTELNTLLLPCSVPSCLAGRLVGVTLMPTTKGQEKLRFPQTSGWVYEVLQTVGQLRNANQHSELFHLNQKVCFVSCELQ